MKDFFGLLPLLLLFGWISLIMIRATKNQAVGRAICEKNTAAIQENTAAVRDLIARLDRERI